MPRTQLFARLSLNDRVLAAAFSRPSGTETAIQLLLDLRAQLQPQSGGGTNVLFLSLRIRQKAKIENLIVAGLDIDSTARYREGNFLTVPKKTALLTMVEQDDIEMVTTLLSHGAKPELTTEGGLNAFDIALRQRNGEMIDLLRQFSPSLESGIQNVDFALDDALSDENFRVALSPLKRGLSPLSRATRLLACSALHDLSSHSLIGPDNEYLVGICQGIINLSQSIGASTTRGAFTDEHTGSDSGFLQVSMWMFQCLTQHPTCIQVEPLLPELPTRVIKIGLAKESMDLRLVQSTGTRGRYATLGHRWEDLTVVKTTKHNLAERLTRIDFSSLTKTMQYAVTITQRLGIEYL